jgi:hypothetical protein
MTDPRISASGPAPGHGGPPDIPASPPGPGVVQVEYAPTLDDALAFFRYDLKLSPRARRQAGIPSWVWPILVGVVVSVGVLIRLMLPRLHSVYFFDLFDALMVVAVVWFVIHHTLGSRLTVRRSLKTVRHNPRFFQKKTMTISPEGLSVREQSGESTTHWHAVVWVIEHGEYAFFYLTERAAVILPKRAFADGRQFEEFVDTARHYHAEARRFVRPEGQA